MEAKRQWLSARLAEGHVFRKLNEQATVMIECAPPEAAWVPVTGDNYMYLWAMFYQGKFETVNLVDVGCAERMLKRSEIIKIDEDGFKMLETGSQCRRILAYLRKRRDD